MKMTSTMALVVTTAITANVYSAPPDKPPQAVNVVNTPDVTVTNPQTEVTVNNDAANPIPVSVQGGASIQPAQTYQTIVFPAGSTVHRESVFTVPSGKRLVLEYISVNYATSSINTNLGTRAIIEVSDIPGTCPQTPKMRQVLQVPERTFVSSTVLNYIVSQPIRLYAEPDEHLCMHLNRHADSVVDRNVGVHLTGHYVDVP